MRRLWQAILPILIIFTLSPVSASGQQTAVNIAYTRVLADEDIRLYRSIFELQEDGHWPEADKLIAQVKDPVLMGYVQYQRYMHPTRYRSKFTELRDWMKSYADLPDAAKIYRLALKRRPGRNYRVEEPVEIYYRPPEAQFPPAAKPQLSKEERERQRDHYLLRSGIARELRRKNPERAERRLWASERAGILSDIEFDTQLSLVANAYYYAREFEKAGALAELAADRSSGLLPEAHWVAGLSAWRIKDWDTAATHFEKVSHGADAGEWLSSAGLYWAARAELARGNVAAVVPLLERAAEHHRTFYGLIAQRQLGRAITADWQSLGIKPKDIEKAMKHIAIRRAAALRDVGELDMADRDARYAVRRLEPSKRPQYLPILTALNLPSAQVSLAREMERDGNIVDVSLFPMPDWLPRDGQRLDKALLYAVMRQESNFMPQAKSHAGARGVMQLMPGTARFISRDRSLNNRGLDRLYEPDFNMQLGQAYLEYLMADPLFGNNLILVTAGYNAGPRNVTRWLDSLDHKGDFLLFLESMHLQETRGYVERVLANLWMYRLRMGQPTKTLDMLVEGFAPAYVSLDGIPPTAALPAAGR